LLLQAALGITRAHLGTPAAARCLAPCLDTTRLQRGIVTVLKQQWSPVQQRLLQKALPVPFKFNDIMMDVEGMAAASTHPGDWRYANFDYD
jgi:hypothetical protein